MPAVLIDPDTWQPADVVALARLGDKIVDPFRAQLAVGDHLVKLKVLIEGTLTVAPDYERKFPGTAADLLRCLQIAVMNMKRGYSIEDVVDAAFCEDGLDVDTKILGQTVKQLIEPYKEPTLCTGSVQAGLQFKKLKR